MTFGPGEIGWTCFTYWSLDPMDVCCTVLSDGLQEPAILSPLTFQMVLCSPKTRKCQETKESDQTEKHGNDRRLGKGRERSGWLITQQRQTCEESLLRIETVPSSNTCALVCGCKIIPRIFCLSNYFSLFHWQKYCYPWNSHPPPWQSGPAQHQEEHSSFYPLTFSPSIFHHPFLVLAWPAEHGKQGSLYSTVPSCPSSQQSLVSIWLLLQIQSCVQTRTE